MESAVFHAKLYVIVGGVNEGGERCRIRGPAGSESDMTHALSAPLQQAGGIAQGCSLKEAHVYVRGEDVDVSERHVSQTCGRSAVVHEFADLVAALAQDLKPPAGNGVEFGGMRLHPG